MSRRQAVRKRRRLLVTTGFGSVIVLTVAASAFGSGCIFDEGNYEGGGRRAAAPTATEPTFTDASLDGAPDADADSEPEMNAAPDADAFDN
ncbi:MAG TPA: hypothetical protein VM580_30930 [Labilithrix sp.]|nr:hypothetical protein [Labilithrix sp.]